MKNISLNFFGENVSINMPTDLASLRQQISEKFMFSPSDAAEIVISYAKDLGKKIIETEQDFVNFISDKITKVDLDISQNSKLYIDNLNNLKKEKDDNTKALNEALKKKDEIKMKKKTNLKKKKEQIKKLENQINSIKKLKKELERKTNLEKKKLDKEEKENNKKIEKLKKKLGIKNDRLKSQKPQNIQNMIEECLNTRNEQYKELEKLPLKITEKIDKITKKVIQFKLKKMHNFEKQLEKKKIQLKPEEKQFFINYPKFCNDIAKRINSFSNHMTCEAKKLFEDIQKVKAVQKDIICPLKKKLEEKKEKESPKKEEKEKKEIHWFIICDGCGMYPIIGKRYNCDICPNFDFCENCYEKEKENHKHSFKKMEILKLNDFKKTFEELKKKEINGKAVHHGFICDGCGMNPIVGNRFKCTVCDNFDFCEACEEKFKNEHNHPFLKIYNPSMAPVSIKCVIPENPKDKK